MNVAELVTALSGRDLRGEIVLVLDRGKDAEISADTLDDALKAALVTASLRDAVAMVAQDLKLPRKQVYDRALQLAQDSAEGDDDD